VAEGMAVPSWTVEARSAAAAAEAARIAAEQQQRLRECAAAERERLVSAELEAAEARAHEAVRATELGALERERVHTVRMRLQMCMAEGQASAVLFAGVPDSELLDMCVGAAQQLKCWVSSGSDATAWNPRVLVPLVLRALTQGLELQGLTPADALARSGCSDPVSQLVAVVAGCAQVDARQQAAVGSSGRSTASGAGGGSAVVRAAESIASNADATRSVHELLRLSRAGSEDEFSEAFRSAAVQTELLSADVALILHQESLDRVPQTGAIAPSSGALRVIAELHEIRPSFRPHA
jgi:hypothetical protein